MGLLEEIQDGATESSSDLTTVLRKCLRLAYKLAHDPFRQWVEHELNGYPEDADLPDYRKVATQSYGHFYGTFQSIHKNRPIPSYALPEDYREMATTLDLRQGIAYYASLADDGSLKAHWDSDAVLMVQDKILQGYTLGHAWRAFGPGTFTVLLDIVRNRVLDFAIQIEMENPDADAAPSERGPIAQETVTNIYNTTILGGQASVGGTNRFENVERQIITGDIDSLKRYLSEAGVAEDDLDRLDSVIEETGPDEVSGGKGKVGAWIKEAATKMATGARDMTIEIATGVINKSLKDFAGLQ